MSAASPDSAAEEMSRAAVSSLAAAFFLTCCKLIAGFSTNSLGVLSEALHSGLDLLAAGITFLAVRIAAIPADKNHPYGHGKVEHLAALAETAFLLLTCGWIIGEAAKRLFFHEAIVAPSFWAFGVLVLSVAVDISRSRMLHRVAKKHKSQALEADALHFVSDAWSSAVAFFGLGALVASQNLAPDNPLRNALAHADTAAAVVVAVIVLRACFRLAKNAVDCLMDIDHGEERRNILKALKDVEGVVWVERLRIRSGGTVRFVDIVVTVDAALGLDAAHETTHRVEAVVLHELPGADVTVQMEPVHIRGQRSELSVVNELTHAHGLAARGVQFVSHADGTHMELYAEADAALSLAEAHARTESLETALRTQLSVVRVVTRLEPKAAPNEPSAPSKEDIAWAEQTVMRAVDELPAVSKQHGLTLLEEKTEPRSFSLTLHCRMTGASSVLQAHRAATALECRLRELSSGRLGRVTIHIEPIEGRSRDAKGGNITRLIPQDGVIQARFPASRSF